MKKKTWLIILAILVAIGLYLLLTGKFMDIGMALTGGMKHKDPTKEAAAFTVTADGLANEFKTNKDAANAKYMGKTILVSGKVSDVQSDVISLGNVAATLDSAYAAEATNVKVGDDVKLQGEFVGYNDLMEEIDISKAGLK